VDVLDVASIGRVPSRHGAHHAGDQLAVSVLDSYRTGAFARPPGNGAEYAIAPSGSPRIESTVHRRNHAGTLILWDRLFGTFEPEDGGEDRPHFGLTTNLHTYNPARIASHEWADMLREVRNSHGWRTKLRYVFGHPGWRQDALSKFPQKSVSAIDLPGID
jgi:hypothetical protein